MRPKELFRLRLFTLIISVIVGNFGVLREAKANRTVQSTEVKVATSTESRKQQPQKQQSQKQQRGVSCPTDTTTLTSMLLRDIPNYTNRVLQRTTAVLPWTEADTIREAAGELVRQPYRPSHVIVAGQADLTPLDLTPYTYTTDPEAGGPLTQVFFTTLSRQYWDLRAVEVQEYHWLFLAQTTDGWQLAFMFSEIDNPQTEPSPMPPRESSQSSVGQALQLWLKDCRAGILKTPAEVPAEDTSESQSHS